MQGILSDVCIEAQARIIVAILTGPFWQDMWVSLQLHYRTFRELGLATDAVDVDIWELCQREQLVLLTANRNQDGPDSLEATIRARNLPTSLPVFTIADSEAIFHSRSYAERVAEHMLDALLTIDNLRGAGRIWLP